MSTSANNILSSFTAEQLNAIADRVHYLRVDRLQLSQSQFASLTKMSQTHLSLIENKKKHIGSNIILKISAATNAKLEWLIYGDCEDDIFHSDSVSKEQLLQLDRAAVLSGLQKTFSLKKSEITFIEYYLNLSTRERESFTQALETLKQLL